MKRLPAVAAMVLLLAGCGSWGYEANPIDGTGKKTDKVDCFQIYRYEDGHGFLGMSRTEDQQGLYCKRQP